MAKNPIAKSILGDGEDYAIRQQTAQEKERLNSTEEIPQYRIKLDFTDKQKEDITESFFVEFDALKKEREDSDLEDKWKEADNLYNGELADNKNLPFNLHVHQPKIKEDAVCRAGKEAFLDSDPIVDISPRPDMGRKDGYQIAQKQAEFIDYAMDEEIQPDETIDRLWHGSFRKFVSIGKLCWSYRREKRKREESYDGHGQPVQFAADGSIAQDNEALRQFLLAYPDAKDDARYKHWIDRLAKGEKIDIVVEYQDVIQNNPELKFIKIEDFYVSNSTAQSVEGLRLAHLVAERQQYSYWDLMKKQADEEFENVEILFNSDDTDSKDPNKQAGESADYKTKMYDLLEATMYFKLKDSEEEVKVKAWFSEEKRKFHGAILYPYYAFDIDYIPFYITHNDYGFYGDGRSCILDLTDSAIAQDALLNLLLTGNYVRNTLTPIAKEGSPVIDLFLEKQWIPGTPLPVDDLVEDVNAAIGFVQWPAMDMNASLALMEMMKRIDSDVTRVSDLTSGRESVLDPTAPASKTIALLQQAGLGIKEYIRTFLPSFNIFCTMVLQLYYQMSQEGVKYKVRRKSETVTGNDPFNSLSRDEMVAKTNVQARASAFVFDKISEKQEAMAGLNIVQTNSYLMQMPPAQYEAVKIALQTLGGRWKNLADKLPSPEEFKKQQIQIGLMGVKMLLEQTAAQQKVTGVAPKLTAEQAGDAVTKAQATAYNPQLAQGAK